MKTKTISKGKTECVGGIKGDIKNSNGGSQFYQQDRVYTMGDIALCIPSQIPGGSYLYLEIIRLDENGRECERKTYIDF